MRKKIHTNNLFEDYLKYHKSYKVQMHHRIEDYEIYQIYSDEEVNKNLSRFSDSFSVKKDPSSREGWIHGNGQIDGNRVRDKYLILTVIAEDGYYRISSMGTGT
ncbi:hypothetical protein HYG86_17985 [Alkalicella caledoniensis]|uniref:Uncharacterized protein n=1 Tax=Alkalicella caledoniensis TaxID=2731377 RepID=A0A7G9WCW6_ALKCA|nr:hypothetical protein [Alkalicella caledoniensis]QNO16528.1 hypothetical protein HYG86_17985 [Alkalicella caledoniensis]